MHLIVGNLHLLMETFCGKTNQNPPYAFVITYPSLPPMLPNIYNSCRNVFHSEALLKYFEEQISLIYYSSLNKSMGQQVFKELSLFSKKGKLLAVPISVSDIFSSGQKLVTLMISKQHFKILCYHEKCFSGSKLMRSQG